MRLLLLFPLLVAGYLHAQDSSVAGLTVDQTGKPLAGVHIRFIAGDFGSGEGGIQAVYGATSDKAGQFSLPPVKPGLFLVMAERAGYLQQAATGFSMMALKPGQQLADYKIVMSRHASICRIEGTKRMTATTPPNAFIGKSERPSEPDLAKALGQ